MDWYHAKPDTGGVMDRNYFKKDYISSCSAARIKIWSYNVDYF